MDGVRHGCTQLIYQSLARFRIDICKAGKLDGLDFLSRDALNVLKHTTLSRCDKQNGFSRATRAACSPDSVHIRFSIERDIVINNVRYSLNVQSTRRDIGRHDHIDSTIFQLFYGFDSGFLIDITVQWRGTETTLP
jgi:hypothetical protein